MKASTETTSDGDFEEQVAPEENVTASEVVDENTADKDEIEKKNDPGVSENKEFSTQASEETEDTKNTSGGGLELTAQLAPSENSENEKNP